MNLKTIPLLLGALILSACTVAQPAAEPNLTPLPTSMYRSAATPAAPEGERITPENVAQLAIVDQWGQGTVYGATLSPDEKTLAVATARGIYFYDRETLEEKQFIELPVMVNSQESVNPRRVIAFSSDGKSLAIAYDQVVFLSLPEGRIYRFIEGLVDNYKAIDIAFDPLGKSIAVVSQGGYAPCDGLGGNFTLYNIHSNIAIYSEYFCPQGGAYSLSFTDSGKVVFTGYSASNIEPDLKYRASIIDSASGSLIKQINFKQEIYSISPDSLKLSVYSSNTHEQTDIVDITTGLVVDHLEGLSLFIPGEQGARILIKGNSWKVINKDQIPVCEFQTPPDLYQRLISSSEWFGHFIVTWNDQDQKIKIWNTLSCESPQELFIPSIDDTLVYSNDRKTLAGNGATYIHLWDGITGKYRFSISENSNLHTGYTYSFSPDGLKLIAGTRNKKKPSSFNISIWDVFTGEKIRQLPFEPELIHASAWNPNGKNVAIYDYSKIHLWDLEKDIPLWNSENIMEIPTISGANRHLIFSPNGETLAFAENKAIIIRNSQTGAVEKRIEIPQLVFSKRTVVDTTAEFSNDWKFIAVNNGEYIDLLKIDRSKLYSFMEYPPLRYMPDLNKVEDTSGFFKGYHDLAFNPDATILAALRCDHDGCNLRIWNVKTSDIIRDIPTPYPITELTFSPDGTNLAVLGDGVIYIFGVVSQ